MEPILTIAGLGGMLSPAASASGEKNTDTLLLHVHAHVTYTYIHTCIGTTMWLLSPLGLAPTLAGLVAIDGEGETCCAGLIFALGIPSL